MAAIDIGKIGDTRFMAVMSSSASLPISLNLGLCGMVLKSICRLRQYSPLEIRDPKLTLAYPKRCQRLIAINIRLMRRLKNQRVEGIRTRSKTAQTEIARSKKNNQVEIEI